MSFMLRRPGHTCPGSVVTNDEIAGEIGETAAWIEQVSGIRERRYAAIGETVVTGALAAAQACLAQAGVAARDVGMLLLASGSADRNVPGPAAQVAAELGLGTAPALDIAIPSAGSLWALCIAKQMAPVTPGGNVLVIASEIMSRRIDRTPEGKNTAILFGDGAGRGAGGRDAGCARAYRRPAAERRHRRGHSAHARQRRRRPAAHGRRIGHSACRTQAARGHAGSCCAATICHLTACRTSSCTRPI